MAHRAKRLDPLVVDCGELIDDLSSASRRGERRAAAKLARAGARSARVMCPFSSVNVPSSFPLVDHEIVEKLGGA